MRRYATWSEQRQHPREQIGTKHPGSKKGYTPRERQDFTKGNAWRAATRSLRCYPGWRKRLANLAAREAQERQAYAQAHTNKGR